MKGTHNDFSVARVKKKTLMQNKKIISKNILKYETDHLKETDLFAKSPDTDAKQTITDATRRSSVRFSECKKNLDFMILQPIVKIFLGKEQNIKIKLDPFCPLI